MGEILNKAFELLKTLPDEGRERIAWEIIEHVEEKAEWGDPLGAQFAAMV